MPLKLGAYVRVSTEEQASVVEGSLDNQKYRLKAFVDLKTTQVKNWGDIIEFYIDDGFSAKDTRRPAYQRMMNDIKKKKIDLILVTDLSRLSRNIFDFCNLMDELEKNEAQFLSIKEQFDSTTPAGKMMIYNMINLAQFEREQVSERVALGTHARAMRGLLNGVRPILGYDKHPDKPGTYIVNEDEAKDVIKIFRYFLNSGSCAKAIKELEINGIKPKLAGKYGKLKINDKWTSQTLTNLLSSACYIGFHEVNKLNKTKDQSRLKPHQQYKLVKATWSAIVPDDDFNMAQELLKEAKKLERVRLEGAEDRFYILSGILRCGECGSPMVGQAAHGHTQVHRYYGHTKANKNTNCSYHRVTALEVESFVIMYIFNSINDSGYFDTIEKNIKSMQNVKSLDQAREKRMIKEQIKSIQIKIDNLLLMQGQTKNKDSIKFAMEHFETLSCQKNELENKLTNINKDSSENDYCRESLKKVESNLKEFERGFYKAKGPMKKMLIRKLLKQIVLTKDQLHIFILLADGNELPNHQIKLIQFKHEKEQKKSPIALFRKAAGDDSKPLFLCSDNNKSGDLTPT